MTTHAPPGSAPQRLAGFVAGFAALLGRESDERRLLADGAALLRDLVAHDDWLAERHAAPSPERYRQYLLHRDPANRFCVVSFVWGPGQSTPIHDHTVWGLIGVLRGAELAQGYRYAGRDQLVPAGEERRLEAGTVDAVSPSSVDIHRVRNAYDDRTSISIHVYGGDIGAIERATYDLQGRRSPFVSGYSEAA